MLFHPMLANISATSAASDDGTPPGLRSKQPDISFKTSDILRGFVDGGAGLLKRREG